MTKEWQDFAMGFPAMVRRIDFLFPSWITGVTVYCKMVMVGRWIDMTIKQMNGFQ